MGERQDAPADRAETPPGFRPIPMPTPGDPQKFPWSIEVALSGGGLRATAFGLGVLLYLADAGLNGKVRGIASVSGGSITNGFVACRGDYGRTGKDEFRVLAAELARKIAFEGIWSSRFVWLYVLALLVVGLVTSAIYLLVSEERSYALTGAAAALALVGLLYHRGWPIARWMETNFLTVEGKALTLGDVAGRTTEHVFCATDLRRSRPFFFSTGHRGRVFSELYGLAAAPSMPLRVAVRASAAFPPLIPPVWFRLPTLWYVDDPKVGAAKRNMAGHVWLTDGGAFNNFGTDWNAFREEVRISEWIRHGSGGPSGLGEEAASFAAADDPLVRARSILIVADASQPQRWGIVLRAMMYFPVLAFLSYLLRTIDIMYSSTLVARTRRIAEDAMLRMSSARAKWGLEGLDKAADGHRWMDLDDMKGPLQLFVPLELAPGEFSESIWQGFSWIHSSPSPGIKHSTTALYGFELENAKQGYKDLWPTCEIVETTFGSLGRMRTLRLIVHGYLMTREVVTSVFPLHWPPPVPDAAWFEELVPLRREARPAQRSP